MELLDIVLSIGIIVIFALLINVNSKIYKHLQKLEKKLNDTVRDYIESVHNLKQWTLQLQGSVREAIKKVDLRVSELEKDKE